VAADLHADDLRYPRAPHVADRHFDVGRGSSGPAHLPPYMCDPTTTEGLDRLVLPAEHPWVLRIIIVAAPLCRQQHFVRVASNNWQAPRLVVFALSASEGYRSRLEIHLRPSDRKQRA
jgi:hypothetical protein